MYVGNTLRYSYDYSYYVQSDNATAWTTGESTVAQNSALIHCQMAYTIDGSGRHTIAIVGGIYQISG